MKTTSIMKTTLKEGCTRLELPSSYWVLLTYSATEVSLSTAVLQENVVTGENNGEENGKLW